MNLKVFSTVEDGLKRGIVSAFINNGELYLI